MFISVPGTATSQVNIHAVMQYDRYMGGRVLLFMDATLTKEMVTDCAVAMRKALHHSDDLNYKRHDIDRQGPPFPVVSSRSCDPRAVHGGLCQEWT